MTDKKGIIPNSFQTPNAHVDHAMQFLSGDEYKVLNFAVRHIFGWHDRVTDRKGRISLSTFCDGFTTKSGEHYGGTGLSRQAVVDIVERLNSWGLLIKEGEPTMQGQEYTIGTDPNWELLSATWEERNVAKNTRGSKLRAAKAAKKAADQSIAQTASLSDRPLVYDTDGGQSIAQTADQSIAQTHSNPQKPTTNTRTPNGGVSSSANKNLTDLIQVWLKNNGMSDVEEHYKNTGYRGKAKTLLAMLINAGDLDAYMCDARKTWAKDQRPITWQNAIEHIETWKATRTNGNGKKYAVQQQVAIEQAAAANNMTVDEYLATMEAWNK